MAVKEDGPTYPTESIISQRARKHYRIPVRSQHWQLRSLISAEKSHLVYFPGGHGSNHIQRLNTTTHECETIKLLNFAPRCLAAKNKWLCCGSETGEFTAIRLDDTNKNLNDSLNVQADVAAVVRPGSNRDPSRDETGTLSVLAARVQQANKNLIAKSMQMAKDRVNCITLWFPSTSVPGEGAYSEAVAVLANNDRTVTIVGLEEFDQCVKVDPLAVITYPDFVNRAIISPDGRLLIALLDDPYLYVHERVGKAGTHAAANCRDRSKPQWEQKQRLLLKSQRKDDKSDSRGSFAACFSASGAYLAVGTQHGTISIFDATLLTEVGTDPLITTFTSSRPESGPGAVRDMEFCPGPYDILAWTEDRGRIGIADMRSNYMKRQMVELSEEAGLEHIDILDPKTIAPHLLDTRNERRDNREGSRREVDDIDSINRPFSHYEMGVIDALRTRRRFHDRAAQRDANPAENTEDTTRGIANLNWSDMHSGPPRDLSIGSVTRALGVLGNTREVPMPRIRVENIERVRSARQLMRDHPERQRTARGEQQDVLQAARALHIERVASRGEPRDRHDNSYLNLLEIMHSRGQDLEREDVALLAPPADEPVGRWEESAIRGSLPQEGSAFGVPPAPDNTAGLAWSEDGRILFVGAQNGIYEYHINVHGRKFCSSISMR